MATFWFEGGWGKGWFWFLEVVVQFEFEIRPVFLMIFIDSILLGKPKVTNETFHPSPINRILPV